LELIVPDSHDWTTLGKGGGGIERFLMMLFKYARTSGMRLTVLCPGPREQTIDSVHFVPIMRRASSELAFTRELRRQLVRKALLIPAGAIVLANAEHYAWAFRGTQFPIVQISHAALPEQLRMRHAFLFVKLFQLFIERYAVSHASRVVVVNPTIKEYYLKRYRKQSPNKFVVVPLGLDLELLEGRPQMNAWERLSLSPSTKLVLFVGRLYPEKNLRLFIDACEILERQGERFHALVIGQGIEEGLINDAMVTRPWLHWIPKLTHYSEILDFIAVSRVLAISSRYESGPLVLLEAIGLGTPVVSTDVGRARELITHDLGKVARDDPVSFAEGIREVLSWEPEVSRQAGKEARSLIDFRQTMKALGEVVQSVREGHESTGDSMSS
jgi:glycosyltransferase involved in cell wall biosynthesis